MRFEKLFRFCSLAVFVTSILAMKHLDFSGIWEVPTFVAFIALCFAASPLKQMSGSVTACRLVSLAFFVGIVVAIFYLPDGTYKGYLGFAAIVAFAFAFAPGEKGRWSQHSASSTPQSSSDSSSFVIREAGNNFQPPRIDK